MTLPNITIGSINGGYYSEFTPEGMVDRVRLYGSTREEVEEKAFEFLEVHDRKLREKARQDPQTFLDRLVSDALNAPRVNVNEDPGALADWERELLEADPVSHPAHYTAFPIEVIELTENLNFCRGNAVKYLARAGLKNPATELEDLQKALWYIEREIDRVRRGDN